ncbi:hypothetical protein EPJ67_03285 [Brachyspira aalborgi]|uniref:Uncharacterized protein n=1 Tax=Brachyspira aalborgi TaxID=29522 RepID=A0A5C8G7H2_9SPIR|nr:hypothetical protein [Brachyspira aalborgi]TXJ57689.1 hypothetical protein EPJ67_03285 [Brachyspira aalborgi]
MESEEDKNVICDFVLYYNEKEYFDMFITIGINLVETNKPTKIYFSTFNGNLTILYEDNLNKGIGVSYSEKDKQHKLIFTQDEIMKQILYLLASKHACFIQIYTKDTFYNFDFTKYNDKMKKNKKYDEAMTRLIYNPK